MKKVKNYIAPELAKKKIARYKYWSIKDETGITITSSDDEQEDRSFTDILDKIIGDNVDAEIQVKFGTNEQSSRQNTPIFIRINEAIEWVEPEEEETVKVNGVPHKLDKNGNVNIHLQTPSHEAPTIETPSDVIRQEMELQLEGLRKESELKEQRYQADLHNKLAEQTLKFKEMMLSEREGRILEREQALTAQEALLQQKEEEMRDTLRGYAKHAAPVLGGLVKQWLKGGATAATKAPLGNTEKTKKARKKVSYSLEDTEENDVETPVDMQEETGFFDGVDIDEPQETENEIIETVEETDKPLTEQTDENI